MGHNPNIKIMSELFQTLVEKEVNNQFLLIDHRQLSVEKFIETKAVHCQRLEEPRYKSVKKILSEKLLPTHLEVALVRAHFTDEYYTQGEHYSINGNTRKFVWDKFEILRPSQLLETTVYHAYNRNEIEQIYRSIDSVNSAETTNQMIGGLCRSSEFNPVSRKIKNGNFGTPLRHAYYCFMGARTKPETRLTDIKNKIEFATFEDEIKFLDPIYLSIENDKFLTKKFSSSNIMASLLILGKKYDVTNPKYIEMIDSLINQKVKIKEGVGGLNDGVSIVWSDLYGKYNPLEKWVDASEGFGGIMIGQILYCLDSYMNDIPLKTRNNQSAKGVVINDIKAKDYFWNYFK